MRIKLRRTQCEQMSSELSLECCDEGRPKAWYVDIDEAKRDDEIAYLRQSIYLRDVDLLAQTLSAFDRFSIRI